MKRNESTFNVVEDVQAQLSNVDETEIANILNQVDEESVENVINAVEQDIEEINVYYQDNKVGFIKGNQNTPIELLVIQSIKEVEDNNKNKTIEDFMQDFNEENEISTFKIMKVKEDKKFKVFTLNYNNIVDEEINSRSVKEQAALYINNNLGESDNFEIHIKKVKKNDI